MSDRLRLAAVGVVLVLFQSVQAADDAHDRLVYGRYSRKLAPSAITFEPRMKFAELDRPATKADVASGKAIFTLEGLGEARVWTLPDRCPVVGRCWTLSDARQATTGYVCQAEELKVEGTWKRYYGFLCEGGAAVVPAQDIELFGPYLAPLIDYQLMQALHLEWGVMMPGPGRDSLKTPEELCPRVSDPLDVSLHFLNLDDKPLEVPSTWYKDSRSGPALREGLTISLFWAGFEPKRPNAGTASDKSFTAVAATRNTHFKPDGANRMLERAESFEALTLDLHDWFKIEREGYYKVCFELDGNAPGPTERLQGFNHLSGFFTIGRLPTQPAIAEFNAQIPPLSGPANEERLKRVIRETIKPKPVEHKPLPADVEALLTWSKPVKGLAARIEYVCVGTTFFVRLKNVSDQPLAVPTGNPSDAKAARLFEIYAQQGSSPWRRATQSCDDDRYFSEPFDPEARMKAADRLRLLKRPPVDRPWVTLRPGEDCGAVVAGSDEKDSGEAKNVKVILRQPDASVPGRWSGVLETPPRAMELSQEQSRALRAVLPFPDHFPPLNYDYSGFVNAYSQSAVEGLHGPNWPLIDMLAIYEPAGVCREFERRMQAEGIVPMKLLLASVAAPAGSEKAALLFLETMKHTGYRTAANLHDALWITYCICAGSPPDWQELEPPDWLLELSLAILADNRFVTGLEKTNFEPGTSFTVGSLPGRLVFALGESKCRKAVPLLIERVRKGDTNWDTLQALGAVGDERAIPVLIEVLEAAGKTVKYSEGCGLPTEFEQSAFALSRLKARQAVPLLLKYVEYPDTFRFLEEIGDPRALPALREMVAAQGKIVRDGKEVYPDLAGERFFAARVALAHFDGDNEVALLGVLLDDPSITRNQRYDVVMRLGRRNDPPTIPYLVRVVKTDSDHYILHMAISNLAEFKYKAAVEGLIECFDVPFKEWESGKSEHVTPATYRNLIAHSLQRITGQPFGADKQQWLRWWQEKGQHSADLK